MTTNKELFAKHVALGTFVETGTCYGRSVEIALELGFKRVLSVEGDGERYRHCYTKFREAKGVVLWHGESVQCLPEMIEGEGPALFWLDAHPSGAGSYGEDYLTNPVHSQANILAQELAIIKARGVRGDVILIDDLEPPTEKLARELFPDAAITVYDTDEGPHKVIEIVTDPVCPRCKNSIDPNVCHCGDPVNGVHDNHHFG